MQRDWQRLLARVGVGSDDRAHDRAKLCAKLEAYAATPLAEIEGEQLARLNRVWAAARDIPRYAAIGRDVAAFASLDAFRRALPILDKSAFGASAPRYYSTARNPDWSRVTGGTTGQPTSLPSWSSEHDETRDDYWVCRADYGVRPGDRCFMFWGHAHLLGHGLAARLRAWKQRLVDRRENVVRFSCYDLSEQNLLAAGDAILRAKPVFLAGYGYSLDRLARANHHRRRALRALGIKLVLGTSESFPFPDSVSLLRDTFGGQVGMDYGTIETQLIASTRPGDRFHVFWKSYLVEAHDRGSGPEILVTSLFERCTPLFRYRLGDRVEGVERAGDVSVVRFDRLAGRADLPVTLPSGRALHAAVVNSLARAERYVAGYQLVCRPDAVTLALKLHPGEHLSPASAAELRRKAHLIDPELGRVLRVETVPELIASVAGKHPVVVLRGVTPALA